MNPGNETVIHEDRVSDRSGAIWAWWAPTLGAIVVWGTAISIFTMLSESLLDMGRFGVEVPDSTSRAEFLLRETAARFVWTASEVVLLAGLIAGVGVALLYVIGPLRRGGKQCAKRLAMAAGGIAIAVGVTALSSNLDPSRIIPVYDAVFEQVGKIEQKIRFNSAHEGPNEAEFRNRFYTSCFGEAPSAVCTGKQLTDRLTPVSNAMTLTFIVLLTLAFTAVLAEPPGDGGPVEHLRAQQQRLRELLYLGGALLAVGVVEMYQLWHWQGIHLSSASEAALGERLARSISLAIGAVLTLMLLAVYLPSSLAVGAAARRCIRDTLQCDEEVTTIHAVESAFETYGFGSSHLEHLGRSVAALAPMAAAFLGGPLATLLGIG